ncbi:hypothetical protein ACLI09_11565 [Flavobacterium sp. RHBU_24]|uniref:hypothetical protein n=1 Tax=Flavobacterium sp. RHBU_24 TaxID=3391185 RepID=UPI0039849844
MKTLNNQTLLYDKDCPLCNAYTAGFIKAGMLDAHGRKPYTSLNETDCQFIDANRARNEIALVDYKNKTVTYGIDSLLKVVGHSFPFIEKVGKVKPVYWFLKKLYSFISYNRKVIIPNKKQDTALQCVPDFNFRYRMAYLIFSGLLTAVVLFKYAELIPHIPKSNFARELLLAFCQLPFQWLFIRKRDKQAQLNYFGNLMTVSLFGALLLLPMLITATFAEIPALITTGWFLVTAIIMLLEHIRRVRLLELPVILCVTWVGYRVLALLVILFV